MHEGSTYATQEPTNLSMLRRMSETSTSLPLTISAHARYLHHVQSPPNTHQSSTRTYLL